MTADSTDEDQRGFGLKPEGGAAFWTRREAGAFATRGDGTTLRALGFVEPRSGTRGFRLTSPPAGVFWKADAAGGACSSVFRSRA